MKRTAAPFLALGISLLVCLALGEIAAGAFLRNLETTNLAVFEAVAPDAGRHVLGLRRSFAQRWTSPEFSVQVETNASGFRESFEFDVSALDVACLGDSFTFGHGVDAGERYSDHLRTALPKRLVASLGYASGFAPQHYLAYVRANAELKPELLVVGLYLGNDLDADVRETEVLPTDGRSPIGIALRARAVGPGGNLVNVPGLYRRPVAWAREHSQLGRLVVGVLNRSGFREILFAGRLDFVPNAPNARALDFGELNAPARASLAALETLDELSSERGGRLLVLFIPQSFHVGDYPNVHGGELSDRDLDTLRSDHPLQARLLRWCEERGVACVDPTKAFSERERRGERLYFARDGHWTPAGHAAAAAELTRHPAIRALYEADASLRVP